MSYTTVTTDNKIISIPRIMLPNFPEPTPQELARRRDVAERVRALREEIGPIGISTSDLIREGREELDGERE